MGDSQLLPWIGMSDFSNVYKGRSGFTITVPVASRTMEISDSASSPAPDVEISPPAPSIESAFSEMSVPRDTSNRPLVVLDAANIGWAYGKGERFDVTGVESALSFLGQYNVSIGAFLPAGYLRKKPQEGGNLQNALMRTDEWERINQLVQRGVLTLVPSGDDDDVYALSYARSNEGYIVSNDWFDNHVKGLELAVVRQSMTSWLAENRCSYAFGPNGEFILNPSCGLAPILNLIRADDGLSADARNGLPATLLRALEAAERSVEAIVAARRPQALKYALLSRLALRYEAGMREGCINDCKYILHLDPTDAVANQIISTLSSSSGP